MRLKSIRDSNLIVLNDRAGAFVAACGYERRSLAISKLVQSPERKLALCFDEWPEALSREENQKEFVERGFRIEQVGANQSDRVQEIVSRVGREVFPSGKGIAFDVSSMTRAWHGAIVRELRTMKANRDAETFFAYVPAEFKIPRRPWPNEIVAPVSGFAALGTPDLPIAAVIGLGYERERALGLQQLLDPQQTVLLVPRSGEGDRFYPVVRRNNAALFDRTPSELVFDYSLANPSATFAMLASIVSGLRESYRVVLASLGPKIFGVLCFLLAARFSDVSVWRVSSGIHGHPIDARADVDHIVVFSATWSVDANQTSD